MRIIYQNRVCKIIEIAITKEGDKYLFYSPFDTSILMAVGETEILKIQGSKDYSIKDD